jgi:hypothetical protein
MIRRPKVGDEVRRKDERELGRVVGVDNDGTRALVEWPHRIYSDEARRWERFEDLVVVTPRCRV